MTNKVNKLIFSRPIDNMNFNFKIKIDIILIITTLILISIGIMFIYSSEYIPEEYKSNIIETNNDNNKELSLYIKQILFCVPSIIIAFILFLFSTDKIQKHTWFLYGGIIILLILVLLIGRRWYGAKSWFGVAGFGIQPSEFAKLVIILTLAKYIHSIGDKIKNWKYFTLGIIITLPIIGLILLQPDFGTVLVFLLVIVTMLFMGGAKISHIITITIAGFIAIIGGVILKAPHLVPTNLKFLITIFYDNINLLIIISSSAIISILSVLLLKKYKKNNIIRIVLSIFLIIGIGLSGSIFISNVLKEHHIDRFTSFMDPSADPQDTGYSLKQSIVAIGAGGFEGQGWLQGKQNHLGFITVKWADYIFSVYAEEMGYKGTILLLILYMLLIYRGIRTIFYAKDMFSGLVATGIVSLITYQVYINLGVTIGILPVVGITLPFLSAGGSSLITFICAIGLLLNIQYEGKNLSKKIII